MYRRRPEPGFFASSSIDFDFSSYIHARTIAEGRAKSSPPHRVSARTRKRARSTPISESLAVGVVSRLCFSSSPCYCFISFQILFIPIWECLPLGMHECIHVDPIASSSCELNWPGDPYSIEPFVQFSNNSQENSWEGEIKTPALNSQKKHSFSFHHVN